MRIVPALATVLFVVSQLGPGMAGEAFVAQSAHIGSALNRVNSLGGGGALVPAMLASPLPSSASGPASLPSSVNGPGNVSSVAQYGSNNLAVVAQTGAANQSAIIQHGTVNAALVTQRAH
jgi:hypothetical protein